MQNLAIAQEENPTTSDSTPIPIVPLRIINFNPYFTQNIDSVQVYQFRTNKTQNEYFWYLQKPPVGLSINKDNGTLTFKAARNYFQSGMLKYDFPYSVSMGVQSYKDPGDKLDTFFTILFYNTEIIPSRIKPSVSGTIHLEEGESLSFRVQCEAGSFPIESILFNSSIPLKNYTSVIKCNDEFRWQPDFDFVKETDSARSRIVLLTFIGSTRYKVKDTSSIRVVVKDALNYHFSKQAYDQVYKNMQTYTLQLKYAFLQLDRKLKKTKSTRLAFDLGSGTTALTGTILNSSSDTKAQKTGKILPSIGLALSPIKEAAAPNKSVEQNQASLVRSSIKRLEYMLRDNLLLGEKDLDIFQKTQKLRDELNQVQVQLIDIPVDYYQSMSEADLNAYFNSKKVNRKYRLNRK